MADRQLVQGMFSSLFDNIKGHEYATEIWGIIKKRQNGHRTIDTYLDALADDVVFLSTTSEDYVKVIERILQSPTPLNSNAVIKELQAKHTNMSGAFLPGSAEIKQKAQMQYPDLEQQINYMEYNFAVYKLESDFLRKVLDALLNPANQSFVARLKGTDSVYYRNEIIRLTYVYRDAVMKFMMA